MPKLTSRILVINDEHLVLREFVKGLNSAARTLDNPLGISFTGVTTAKEALSVIESDRDLQSVLVDDRLYSLAKNGSNSKKKLQMSALELVQRITRFRPELDVYILIAQEKEDDVVDKLFTESVDGYFYREERDYRGIYRILNAQIQERARTPFYDQLKNYVWMAKDQWHTPGHSSGESLRGSPWINDFYEFMGEHVFDADLSVSVPMLDSLMEPKAVIAEAQAKAAKAFGARRTFFATNGTSTANKVIFQTLLAPGEKLILDRNCHKSVHHGVVLSGFSQASMIHVNDRDFREHLFRENFNMHTSTSPQYGLIASLDIARKQAVMEGYKLLTRTLELATEVRKLVNSTKVFRVLELDDLLPPEVRADGILLDPTKVTIDISGCGYTVEDLQKELFERYNIQVEKSTFNTLTLLLTIGTTRSKVSRLYDALMRIARQGRPPRRLVQSPEIPGFTRLRYLPRDAYYCGGELLPVFDERERVNKKLVGCVCADQIVPYPPGIPVLVPGQVITSKIADYLGNLLRSTRRMEMHGVVHEGYLPCIRVLKPGEEKSLRRLG